MHLTCPACGAIASAEAWQADAAARQVLDIVARLPGPVAIRALPYLGLFRRGKKRTLAWPTAVKLAGDLQDLVASGMIQWDGGEERPAPPDLWARIMDQMIAAHKDGLNDHNYLRKAVWSEAKPLAAQSERNVSREAAKARSEEEAKKSPEKKARTCFNCAHFKPPSKCAENHHPPGGNMAWGCGEHWIEKVASAGGIMSGLAEGLKRLQDK